MKKPTFKKYLSYAAKQHFMENDLKFKCACRYDNENDSVCILHSQGGLINIKYSNEMSFQLHLRKCRNGEMEMMVETRNENDIPKKTSSYLILSQNQVKELIAALSGIKMGKGYIPVTYIRSN